MCDIYSRSFLIKLCGSLSFILTVVLTTTVLAFDQLEFWVILSYACLRGCVSAFETPVRNAILPIFSANTSKSKVVSNYSLVLNICRSIGPAIAGFLLGFGWISLTFAFQSFCLFISLILSLPIKVQPIEGSLRKKKSFALKEVKNYFSKDVTGRNLFLASLIAMVFGFSYTTILPVLTDFYFPGEAEVFGIAMTLAALGAIVATLTLPKILVHVKEEAMCYMSLLFFAFSLLSVLIPIKAFLFISLFSIGLFGQWTRSSNRIYFQNKVPEEKRGKVLSVVLMDRGMIPLGALLISFLVGWKGVIFAFVVMGVGTSLSTINYWKLKIHKSKKRVNRLAN